MKRSIFQWVAILVVALGALYLVWLSNEGSNGGQAGVVPWESDREASMNVTQLDGEDPSQAHDEDAEAKRVSKSTTDIDNPDGGPLPDLDGRINSKVSKGQLGTKQEAALERLRAAIPGVTVDFDPVTGAAKWVASNARLLTDASEDGMENLRGFVDEYADLFGHGSAALAEAREVTDYTTEHNGMRKRVLHQEHKGLEIFEAVFQANLTSDGRLVNVGSQFVSEIPDSLNPTPQVRVETAVASAGRNLGEAILSDSVRPMGEAAEAPDRHQQFRAAMLTDADAKLVWVPMNEAELRLAWDVTLTSRSRGEMYRVLVDAQNEEILVRQALTAYISDASYRVFTTESPTPYSPGDETPSSLQPLAVDRVMVTTSALDTTASPNGWINDGDNTTSGNNADAYTDTDADNSPDLPRTTGSPSRVFDFPLDLTQAPSNFKDASVTQLFYWTNFMHDRMYQLGFTEAAGNFQIDNFGRGGSGNDPVNAEAQDGSGTNNANFSTPVDGGRGRMQMFNWTPPTPDRDGSFEAEVVLHEYGHGVSNRLVGGPTMTISQASTRGMGEGWSDFYGLALTAEAADNPHGNWARGAWSRYFRSNWFSENYYYGARRYSYSTDMRKNPLTFKDIDPNQIDLHTDVPRNPTYSSTQDATQVHYQGTVWCVTLWDLRANLILKHGFAVGNERALFLVTEGMKLGPANPNFVESRDGIIQATMVSHPEDLGEVWSAFAKRGLGHGASAPASSTTVGIVESFTVPDDLEIDDRSGWNISGASGGPFTPATQTLTLSNDGGSPLDWSADTHAAWLSASPASGTLAPGANEVVTITTQADSELAGFQSTNLVFTNTGTGFNQVVGVRLYVTPPAAYSFELNSDPGWSSEGEWAFGMPTGEGGGTGNPDPNSGATGSNVFGVNLAGDVSTTLGGPHYLTLGPVDLSVHRKTRLQFQRWLNTNSLTNTRTTVEVSTNGTDWREVFVNPGAAITDDAWTLMDYDISTMTDQQSTVWFRWGYQTLTSSTAYSGWNIDDVNILGEPTAFFELSFTSPVSEADGVQTGTIALNQPKAQPLTIQLASSDVTAATVPASVILPAGETTVEFDITPVDDSILDGAQTTLITAATTGVLTGQSELVVNDDETAVLTLTVPASISEGDAGVSASVSVSEAPLLPVEVTISSDDSSVVEAPASVIIPAGSTGPVVFALNAPDNALAHGPRSATVTAAVAGWTGDSELIPVVDDEAPQITLSGPASVRESVAPEAAFTVSVNTPLAVPLTIGLASSDESELTVPLSVEIPAGSLSAEFSVTVIDDLDVDGPQTAEITASASGYAGGTLPVTVNDNDAAQFGLSTIPSPQKRNTPFIVRVTAQDTLGEPIPTFSGSPIWWSDSSMGPVAFTATVVNGFSGGAADYEVIVTEAMTGVELTVDDGSGHTGTSNAFDVVAVPLARFQWSGLPASATIDGLVNATVTALDDEGNVASGYESPTTLEVYSSSFDFNIGSSSTSNPTTPLVRNTAHEKSRVQMIYTAEEFGGAPQWLSQINLYSAVAAGQTMSNFKVRVKATDRSSFGSEGFDVGGWTTVYESSSQSASSAAFPFITPYFLDGTQNLMVDVSFSNTSTSTPGEVRVTPTQDPMMMHATGTVTDPDPLAWGNGTGPAPQTSLDRPTLAVFFAALIGELPASPASFAGGVWNGTVHNPALTSAIFRARSPDGVASFSDRVGVISVGLVTTGSEIYFQDFESGAKPAEWTFSGTGTFRTQVTSSNTPRGSYHVTMDSSTNNSFARNEADLQIDLAGRTDAMLEFYAREFADESHIPPPSPFMDGADFDGVAISPDGVQWAEVRSLRGINSSTHALYRVSLDPVMRRMGWSYGPNMRIRFNQYDNSVITSDGIAFDDVRLRVNNSNGLAMGYGPNAVTEGSGPFDVTITAPSISASNRTVTLTCTQTAKLQVPATVVLPANQTSVVTQFTALDDPFVDGWKSVRVTAAMSGLTTTYHWVEVQDNDGPPVLEVTVPATMAEGDPSATGTLKIIPPPATTTEVEITFSDIEQMTGSVGLTISAGRESATFTVTPIDDTFLDGTQQVTVTARELLTNATGSAVIEILDNDTGSMTLALPASVQEGGALGVGTVQLSAKSNTPATITLSSADPDQATVQPSVVVPVGQLTANFLITAVDDGTDDGTQTATIHASSVVYGAASETLDVLDNDPTFFDISPVASPQVRNAPFIATVFARDSSGATLVSFNGTAVLSAEASGVGIPVEPSTQIQFADGAWTGEVSLGSTGVGAILTATTAGGAFGDSNPFDVGGNGPAVGLAITPVGSPQTVGAAIPLVVTAVDAAGVRVSEVTGPVLVELVTDPAGLVVTSFNLELVAGRVGSQLCLPASIASVFLRATAGGLSGQTSSFGIQPAPFLSYPPLELLFEDDFETGASKPEWVITGTGNHRTEVTTANTPHGGAYHMVMDSSADYARNEATLTLDLTGKQDVFVTFWMKEMGDEDHSPPTNPFMNGADFDGVAISADGVSWHEVQALRSGIISGSWQEFTLNLDQLALDSGIEFGPNFQIRLNHYDNFPVPTDGFAFDDIRIVANGLSPSEEARFNAFADDFEEGVWRPEWLITGTGNSRTEITDQNGPQGNYHLVMDANPALNSRNEATLTLDLTGLVEAELRFWMKENADEDHSPPSNPFTDGADFDGVAISEDGATWYEVQGLRSPDTSSAYKEFVVDLDAALQASGFAYNSAFRIRFNHFDNSPWTSGDGFAFDNISVTAVATNELALNLPTSVQEGDSGSATVSLLQARGVETIVNLESNRPDCVRLQQTVTIPAGANVSLPFDITVPDDNWLTGALQVEIRASASGLKADVASLTMLDNDSPDSLVLSLASSLEEGGTINGTVEFEPASAFDVTLLMESAPSVDLTLPGTLTLAAGQTMIGFSIERPENLVILEPTGVEISASLGGSTQTRTLALPDNDLAPLALTLPLSVTESDAPVQASVGLPGLIFAESVEVSLSSSLSGALSVPTSVTIPAGSDGVSFNLTPVNNGLQDGTRSVTITASATELSGSNASLDVLDDEVHHLVFDPVPSPQVVSMPFPITIRALTIDGTPATFGSTADLIADVAGTPVALSPVTTGSLAGGSWTGDVTISELGAGVRLSASASGLLAQSGLFDVVEASQLQVSPQPLDLATPKGEAVFQTNLTLTNPGGVPTDWQASLLFPDSVPEVSLEGILFLTDSCSDSISQLIPNRFDFTDGNSGRSINDGGSDMYDNGNYLSTNEATAGNYLNYSDGVITSSVFLGSGGQYFTRKYPGLFVFAADVVGLDYFQVTGNLGQDGVGSTDEVVLTSMRAGTSFKGFVKRVFGAANPSVNHLMIVEDNGMASHSPSGDTNSDDHRLNGLAGVTRIYYLLYASSDGGYIDDDQTQAIMDGFLDVVTGSGWMTLAETSGTVPSGSSSAFGAMVDPGHLEIGVHRATVRFDSNDATNPQQDVPVTLTVFPEVDHFEWESIPSPQSANVPFAASVTAKDSTGAVVSSFRGSARLEAVGLPTETISGTDTTVTFYPFYAGTYNDYRNQCIYTPAEVGPAGRLQSVAFDVTTIPGLMREFTIRLKHTSKSDYSAPGSVVWEADGWTTVYHEDLTVASSGWLVLPLSAPFDYDGTSNLMVDISFDNPGSSSTGYVRYSDTLPARVIRGGSFNSNGSPLGWSGSTPTSFAASSLPNLRFNSRGLFPSDPPVLTFENGVWSGNPTVQRAGSELSLKAIHSSLSSVVGVSQTFDVSSIGTLTVVSPDSGQEGESLGGSVTVDVAPVTNLTINLTSSDLSEATVPSSVIIPIGQTSVDFSITLIDDGLFDGPRPVVISAATAGYDLGTASLTVLDVTEATLTVSLPAALTEGDAIQSEGGLVMVDAAPDENLVVQLASSDASEMVVPETVVIPAGSVSATFALQPVNDTVVDGSRNVTVTATLNGFSPGNASMEILDNESRQLYMISSSSFWETNGTISAAVRVYLTSVTEEDLTISLASNDATEVQLPATVTILGGQSDAYFDMTLIDDLDQDGTQSVEMSAIAATFLTANRTVTVKDNELHHFTWDPIASPQVRGAPFNVRLTAKAIDDVTIAYSGSPDLTAEDGGSVIGVSPATLGGFVNGIASAEVTVTDFATSAVLMAMDAVSGSTGTSNAVSVGLGTLDHFEWDPIPSHQFVSQPFLVTVSARDKGGNLMTDFIGSTDLFVPGEIQLGTGFTSSLNPFYTTFQEVRTQLIMAADELGGAKRINSLALDLRSLPSIPLSRFTIRMKHTAKSDYSGSGNAVLEPDGWTLCYQADVELDENGWKVFHLSTPFDYDGSNHLMIDLSYDNASTGAPGAVSASSLGETRMVHARSSNQHGDPLDWSGSSSPTVYSSTARPDVRLGIDVGVPVNPPNTGAYTAGVWSGTVSIAIPLQGLMLVAQGAESAGTSNSFDVGVPAPILNAEPPFTGGASNEIVWSPTTPPLEVQIQRDEVATFPAPFSSPWLSGLSHTFTGLLDATEYHYRARSRLADPGAQEVWSQTSQEDFEAGTATDVDLASSPGSVRLAEVPSFFEDFDGPGTTMAGTLFSNYYEGTGATRILLASDVPNTTPQPPISTDDDKEVLVPPGVSLTTPLVSEHDVVDCSIEGYYVPYPDDALVTPKCGFLLRATDSGSGLTAYSANLIRNGSNIYSSITRWVDGIGSTLLLSGGGSTYHSHIDNYRLRFSAVGSTLRLTVWEVTVAGGQTIETLRRDETLVDSTIDSGRAGIFSDGYGGGGGAFDEIGVTYGTVNYSGFGMLTSSTITRPQDGRWGVMQFSGVEPTGTSLRVDVLSDSNSILVSDVQQGTDLSTIPQIENQVSIRLRAMLTTSDPAQSPQLEEWSVSYNLFGGFKSNWSNVVSSTQDASPPVIAMNPADEKFTALADAEIGGTAADAVSGVASVTVNGAAASTADGFANWTKLVSGLAPGSNTVTIEAADNAVPPSTASVSYHIFRIEDPTGQTNANGVPDLLNHALNLDAPGVGREGLPAAAMAENPGDGKTYLTLQYRRRINRAGFRYIVETSSSLAVDGWDDTGASVEEVDVTPNPDGVTETCTVRITPAIGDVDAKFVRLRVEVD